MLALILISMSTFQASENAIVVDKQTSNSSGSYWKDHTIHWTRARLPAIPPATEWNKTFGGTSDDGAYDLLQTEDGGYIIAGYTQSFGAGGSDFWLIKTDAQGNELWNKTYGGTGDEAAFRVLLANDGGYLLAGWTNSFGAGGYDFWVVKTDANGNCEWNKTYGGTSSDGFRFWGGWEYWPSVAAVDASSGSYAIAGYSQSYGGDFVAKIDSFGNVVWNKTYASSGDTWLAHHSFIQTSDGGYIVYDDQWAMDQFRLFKIDGAGNVQWSKTYDGTGWYYYENMGGLIQQSDGSYIVVGSVCDGEPTVTSFLRQISSSGQTKLLRIRNEPGDHPSAVIQVEDGKYVVTGSIISRGSFYISEVDETGSTTWLQTYGGFYDSWGWSIIETSDKGCAAIGTTKSLGAGGLDAWIIKLTPDLPSTTIIDLISTNQQGDRKGSFNRGSLASFQVTLEYSALSLGHVLITVNIYDSNNTSIGVASFQGPTTPGISTFIISVPIPASAHLGNATVYANAFSDWPHKGGVPYCPEVSATFQVTGP
jgi:predicted secreted protein